MTSPTVSPETDLDLTLEEPDDDLCHVYCSICYPVDVPAGYVHFCGTPIGTDSGTPCDEECFHLMCVMCLEMSDEHLRLMHSVAA